jgi:hypothetical protein
MIAMAMFGASVIFIFVLAAAASVLMIIAMWIIISKSGQPGVAAIVPVWNSIALLQAAGKPWWWIFLFVIPIVNIILMVMMYHGLSLNFGKGAGFTVGLVFLPFVFFPILAFGGTYAPVNHT